MSESQIEIKGQNIAADIQRGWKFLFGLGVLFVIFGSIGLTQVIGLTMISMVFFGILLLIAGLTQFFDVSKCREWKGTVWHAFIALMYVGGGCVIIYDPLIASSIITAILAGMLITIGLARIIMSLKLKGSRGWFWILLSGIAAIALGIMLVMQWPYSGLWFIGLFIAIELIISGWTYILLALSIRRG